MYMDAMTNSRTFEVSFLRPAMVELADFARHDALAISDSLQAIARRPSHDRRMSVKFAALAGGPAQVAYLDTGDNTVILSAGQSADEATRRYACLSRVNWKDHLIRINFDGLLPEEITNTVLDAIKTLDVLFAPNFVFNPHSEGPYLALAGILDEEAKTWASTDARQNFKELMTNAVLNPQRIERPGGDDVYVLSRHFLESSRSGAMEHLLRLGGDRTLQPIEHLAPRPARGRTITSRPNRSPPVRDADN
jgi:hypothetical protein